MSEVDRYLDNPYLKFRDYKREEVTDPLESLESIIDKQSMIIKELQELVVILKKDLKNALMINAPVRSVYKQVTTDKNGKFELGSVEPGSVRIYGYVYENNKQDPYHVEISLKVKCDHCKGIHGRCSCP